MRRNIQVKQRDVSDCGAACLASVAAYYGLHVPVSKVRQYAGTNKAGTSLSGLISAAGQLNLTARGVNAAGVDLNGIPVPAIFHLTVENKMQHFVVVYKIGKNFIQVMDPAFGKLAKLSVVEFGKSWTGVVMLLMPSERFSCGKEKKDAFTRFWELIVPHKKLLFIALLGAFVYTTMGLSTSFYVQKMVDSVLPGANRNLMNTLGITMLVLLFIQTLAGYFRSIIILRTGQEMDTRLIMGYYRHLLKLPQHFFDDMRVGEIISRVNDAVRIRLFINDISINVIVQIFTVILSITIMFVFFWKLALMILLSVPVYAMIFQISDRLNTIWQRKMMETGAVFESQFIESMQGITTIRFFGSASFFMEKTENVFNPFKWAIFKSGRNGLIMANLSELVTGVMTISVLWVGSYYVLEHVFTTGELLSFYTLTLFFTNPVRAVIGANRSMQDAIIAADRLFEIIDLETETENQEDTLLKIFPAGNLIFERVTFGYGLRILIFDELHFSIQQFGMTAVIGDSGCGKSTMLSLIQKFYTPQNGHIKIGDVDLQHISNSVIRKYIAVVPQQIDLFQGTILSNIALGEKEPDQERIHEICGRLGLDEFIMSLPDRYLTVIKEQGINLSGGQKQRLGIARAIYKDPVILILDEATSAQDPENEIRVQETLHWFYNGMKTIIIITHRLKTVLYCDAVIYLRQGKEAITGTHQQLILENPVYSAWWNK